jgi:hypothetical protein
MQNDHAALVNAHLGTSSRPLDLGRVLTCGQNIRQEIEAIRAGDGAFMWYKRRCSISRAWLNDTIHH